MQTRLQMCERYLKDIESRLLKLQTSGNVVLSEEATVTESLDFIRKALIAVSETRLRVDRLHSKRMSASGN